MATGSVEQSINNAVTKNGDTNDKLLPFLTDDLKLSMWIPAELAGKVIGKKGLIIGNIKQESQVSYITAMQPVGESLWVAVVMLGGAAAVFTAYKAIASMVNDEVDDVILEFPLSKINHSYLIQGGQITNLVRKLSAETNVRIFIPTPTTHPYLATLEGEAINVQKAYQLLVKLHNNPAMQIEWSKAETKKPSTSSNEINNNTNHSHSIDTNQTVTKSANITESSDMSDNNDNGAHKDAKQKTVTVTVTKIEKESTDTNQTTESSKPTEQVKSSVESKTMMTYEKSINIPTVLVGLLLARRINKSERGGGRGRAGRGTLLKNKNVLNQIQSLTHTLISRISGPKTYVKPKKSSSSTVASSTVVSASDETQRKRRNSSNDEEEEEGDDDEDSNEDDDDEDNHDKLVKETNSKLNISVTVNGQDQPSNAAEEGNSDENAPVLFKVSGNTEKSVDLAIEYITKIINGDRITDAIASLKVKSAEMYPRSHTYNKSNHEGSESDSQDDDDDDDDEEYNGHSKFRTSKFYGSSGRYSSSGGRGGRGGGGRSYSSGNFRGRSSGGRGGRGSGTAAAATAVSSVDSK